MFEFIFWATDFIRDFDTDIWPMFTVFTLKLLFSAKNVNLRVWSLKKFNALIGLFSLYLFVLKCEWLNSLGFLYNPFSVTCFERYVEGCDNTFCCF